MTILDLATEPTIVAVVDSNQPIYDIDVVTVTESESEMQVFVFLNDGEVGWVNSTLSKQAWTQDTSDFDSITSVTDVNANLKSYVLAESGPGKRYCVLAANSFSCADAKKQ